MNQPVNRVRCWVLAVASLCVSVQTVRAQSGDVPAVGEPVEAAPGPEGEGQEEPTDAEERGLVEGGLDAEEVPADREPADELDTTAHDDDEDGLPDAEHAFDWPSSWGRFGSWDYALIGASTAAVVGTEIVGPLEKTDAFGPAPADAGWQATNRMDDWFRARMRRGSYDERGRMRDTSDLLLSLTVSFPFLFDGLLSAFWFHESPEVGRELALLAIEVQFVTAAIQSTATMLSSRVRPYVQDCPDTEDAVNPEVPELTNNGDCTGSVRFRSFFSGHTSQAFAGAVTSCVFHAKFPLYGGGSRDLLPCVGLLASATAVGLFRVMGDMHHITDVITGAIVGSAVGAALPLLRMHPWAGEQSIAIVPNRLGLALVGTLR